MNGEDTMEINESWALILNDTYDLISHNNFSKANEIVLNTSSQPNSRPHIGTVTTFLFNFAIARHFKNMSGVPASVCFDQLENTPNWEDKIKDEIYLHYLDERESKDVFRKNLKAYRVLLDYGSKLSGIPYRTRTYKEFQNIPAVRKCVITIMRQFDECNKYLKFPDRNSAVRTKCPYCGLVKKKVNSIKFNGDEMILYSSCIHHGEYKVVVTQDNDAYFSMGMQLRDVTKGIIFSDLKPEKICIMCDSRDWGGEWNNIVHCMTKQCLGIDQITDRIFTPLIIDSTGRKVSKTIYIREGYPELKGKEHFLDFEKFLEVYGEEGVKKLYKEVINWAAIPRKAVRNYSLEYIENCLS